MTTQSPRRKPPIRDMTTLETATFDELWSQLASRTIGALIVFEMETKNQPDKTRVFALHQGGYSAAVGLATHAKNVYLAPPPPTIVIQPRDDDDDDEDEEYSEC